MKLGLPWSVNDIRADARETAEEAARQAGLPLNDWLNTVILQRATEQGIRSRLPPRGRGNLQADEYSRFHLRLDELASRIEDVTRRPAHYPSRQEPTQFDAYGEILDRLEHRLREVTSRLQERTPTSGAQLPPNLERASAEFTARRHALDGDSAFTQADRMSPPVATPAAVHAQQTAQSASGLEAQLRHITEELEALNRPAIEDAIEMLRAELGDISRTLKEAMPRNAVESIEMQIQDLAQRISDDRYSETDQEALAGVERSLADIRDTLRTMMPAEKLVGYNEAIAELGRKLDLIISERDPTTLQRLDSSIMSLRDLSEHVASSEAVSDLSAQVWHLTEKLDSLAVGRGSDELLANLQDRIETLTDALSEHTHAEMAVPQRLEALLQSLSDKIEKLQDSDSGQIAIGHLEDRIVKLMERLDVSESRLSKFDAIERGITDLLVHIEDLRAANWAPRAENPAVDSLREEIAQTRGSIDAMRGQLGGVADRLATVERNIRAERERSVASGKDAEQTAITENPATIYADPDGTDDATISHEQEGSLQPPQQEPQPDDSLRATVASLNSAMAATANQIWPSLSSADSITAPDRPLEPGSGPPPRIAASPRMRIAVSEADLAGARPNTAAAGNKSNFIAAARRAAQAAGHDQKARVARPDATRTSSSMPASSRGKNAARVKSLFVAASVVAIVVGSIHYVGHVFDFSIFEKKAIKVASAPEARSETTELALPANDADTTADTPKGTTAPPGAAETLAPTAESESETTANPPVPPVSPGLAPIPAPGAQPASPGTASVLNQPPQAPSMLAPPSLNPGASVSGDVTGSIARAPDGTAPKRQPEGQQPTGPIDNLPPGIGGPQLRGAALAGDAGAAYEVALRFAEARGVPGNLQEAARWFERASNKGLTPAQFRYASMLEKGQGVKKDLIAAQRLYIEAAAKGHAKAMHNLAVLYAEGIDGKPDYGNAAQWFRKAAEFGVADSQYNLGVLAARGLGTERNLGEAYKWFALAAAQGDREAARKRDELATHLDAQALTAAQQAVKNFTPVAQPQAAVTVPSPPGGWDRGTPPREKPRAAGPLSISAFNSGKL